MRERSRRASSQPDYCSQLSVDPGVDLLIAALKRSAPSERLSWLRLIFHTRDTQQHQQHQHVGNHDGLGRLVEKNTQWSGSARPFAAELESVSAGLDAWVQGLADRTRRNSRHNSYCSTCRRWLEFFMSEEPNWIAEDSHEQTNRWPGYHLRVRFRITKRLHRFA